MTHPPPPPPAPPKPSVKSILLKYRYLSQNGAFGPLIHEQFFRELFEAAGVDYKEEYKLPVPEPAPAPSAMSVDEDEDEDEPPPPPPPPPTKEAKK